MVERAGLENRCARKGTVGSNPTSSAEVTSTQRDSSNPRDWEIDTPRENGPRSDLEVLSYQDSTGEILGNPLGTTWRHGETFGSNVINP